MVRAFALAASRDLTLTHSNENNNDVIYIGHADKLNRVVEAVEKDFGIVLVQVIFGIQRRACDRVAVGNCA